MKKTLFILISMLLVPHLAKAQTTEFDALNLAQSEIRGTARYMGMAGAFGALGGDVSAIKNNAGGLAIYRSSELSLSYSLLQQNTKSFFNTIETRDNLTKFGYNNFSYVWSMNTRKTKGLLYSNWSFSHNRTKNFNRSARVIGQDINTSSIVDQIAAFTNNGNFIEKDLKAEHINDLFRESYGLSYLSILGYNAFLIDNTANVSGGWKKNLPKNSSTAFDYDLIESGYISESSLSWGGNINNTFYLGASVNFSNIRYSKEERYIESSDKSYTGSTDKVFKVNLRNSLSTSGAGVNFNFGLIYRPIDPLRIGLAYTTGTRYSLRDEAYDVSLNKITALDTHYDYNLRTPGKVNASIAYVLGGKLILSSELIYSPSSQLYLTERDKGAYDPENEIMDKFNAELSFKTGLEFRLSENFYARTGFAHTAFSKGRKTAMATDAMKKPWSGTIRTDLSSINRKSNRYLSAGLGYRGNFWSFDFACVKRNFEENFIPYSDTSLENGSIKTNSLDFIGTLAFRF